MECTYENEFDILFNSLFNEMISTENTKLFGEYLKQHYSQKATSSPDYTPHECCHHMQNLVPRNTTGYFVQMHFF